MITVKVGNHDHIERIGFDPLPAQANEGRGAKINRETNSRAVYQNARLQPPTAAESVTGT